jgi:hypothetical protein
MIDENEDLEAEEFQTLKGLAQGRAGEDLAQQLGLADAEAPLEEAPLEGDPAAAAAPTDEFAGIPPELLARVIEMLKAKG